MQNVCLRFQPGGAHSRRYRKGRCFFNDRTGPAVDRRPFFSTAVTDRVINPVVGGHGSGCSRALLGAVLGVAAATTAAMGGSNRVEGVEDLSGRSRDPFSSTNRATVLIFVANDCPISNRYAPEIQRLWQRFAPLGAAFWLVHADPDETPAAIQSHDQDYSLSIPALRDLRHRLTAAAHVETTPSAAVFFADGRLAYHGRIDDRFADLNRERPTAVHRDLADAIAAAVAGRLPATAETPAVGCTIPSLK